MGFVSTSRYFIEALVKKRKDKRILMLKSPRVRQNHSWISSRNRERARCKRDQIGDFFSCSRCQSFCTLRRELFFSYTCRRVIYAAHFENRVLFRAPMVSRDRFTYPDTTFPRSFRNLLSPDPPESAFLSRRKSTETNCVSPVYRGASELLLESNVRWTSKSQSRRQISPRMYRTFQKGEVKFCRGKQKVTR